MPHIFPYLAATWVAWPIAAVALILFGGRAVRRAIRRDVCAQCRYNLAKIWAEVPRCPECGHSVGGHPVLAADCAAPTRAIDAGHLALVWWLMITLAIGGINILFLAARLATDAQIAH